MSWEIFTLPFVRTALAAGLLVGATCSYLGVFVVLRRIVFVGIALAQLATTGVALSFYLPLPPTVLALATTLTGAMLLGTNVGGRFLPRESVIGFAYAASAAAAILLVAKSAQGEAHVLGLLFGNILTLTERDLLALLTVTVVVMGMQGIFAKEILFASFDPETARAAGFRVTVWNLVFYLGLALAIAVAIRAAGALLVFSYLLQPAVIGLRMSDRFRGVLLWSVGSSVVATVVGIFLSVLWDLPTGPTVIAVSSVMVLLAWLVRRF